jgi:transcriptional regulator with XRE-family HTH domain
MAIPARSQSSATDSPASLALASISAGVSSSDIPSIYLHKCTPVNSSHATRRINDGYALVPDVEARDRQAVKDFLLEAAAFADTDLSGLAKLAGIAPSTLTRFVNGDSKFLPTTRTLTKIAAASGYKNVALGSPNRGDLLEALGDLAAAMGLNLAEAAILSGVDRHRLRRASEWMELLSRLPPSVERNTFDMLQGVLDTITTEELQAGPSETRPRRARA